jgi:hypothetical protein
LGERLIRIRMDQGGRFFFSPCVVERVLKGSCFRGCVGRNLASMQLLIIVSSLLRRYDFVLEEPDKFVS